MNKAFIQHAQNDIHRDNCRHDKPQRVAQRRFKRERCTLEIRGDINGHIKLLLGAGDGFHRLLERVAVGNVERHRGGWELVEVVNRQRPKTLLNSSNCVQRYVFAIAAGEIHIVKRG